MPNKPHSDKSARAQRRAAARELSRAPSNQPNTGGIPISVPDLLVKIGALTVEKDFWVTRVQVLEREIQRLLEEQQPLEGESPEQLDEEIDEG